jgi:hypothetical protein
MGFLKSLKQAVSLPSDRDTINQQGQEMRRIRAEGEPGRAEIRAMRDTGERLAGNWVLDLDLHVKLDAGTEYDVTHRMTIAGSDTSPYAPGKSYAVRVDPADQTKLVFSGT